MVKKNNAKLVDVNLLISAGVNPKTGLPEKYANDSDLYINMRRLFRVKDEQSFVNRIEWENTHLNIESTMIERFLYYRWDLAFFPLDDKFYLMPFALDGGLDFYARENSVHPIPFADDNSENTKRQKALLSTIKLSVVKSVEEAKTADKKTSCVIIRDYTPQFNIQKALPRATLQDAIIGFESSLIPYMRTAIINSTGVQGVQVADSDEATNVLEASNAVNKAALEGKPWVPLLRKLQLSSLNGISFQASDYLMALQGIDNLRESFLGTADKGLYTKSEHTNDSENEMDEPSSSPLLDSLNQRKHACEIINAIWNLGINVKLKEEENSPKVGEGIKEGTQNVKNKTDKSEDLS